MKFKYGTVVLGSFLGLSVVLAACGARGKFDQFDDGKIKLASSLTSKAAANALQTIIEKYNIVKSGKDYPIEITQIAGGYDGGRTDLQTRVSVKDKTNFYNLILNYPDLVSVLARSGMELLFDKVNVDKLEPNFLKFNEQISGVAKSGNYGIPVSLSTDILVLNGPVLHYILNSAKKEEANSQVKSQIKTSQIQAKGSLTIYTDENTKSLWEKIQNSAKANGETNQKGRKAAKSNKTALVQLKNGADTTTNEENKDTKTSDDKVKQTWGDYVEKDDGLKNYTFRASVFENWHDFLDFSTRVAKSFTEKVSNITNKKGTDIQGVLGVDSSPNVLFASVFAAGGGNYENFFYKLKDGRADFSNFKNKGSSYQNLQSVFKD
ncbi:hypothetical protein F530_01565 [Mycoplasmoides pneumoniae 54089]|nr:hypothetical protein F533_01565 [Mycoplasmoides pneumoniae 51494]ALA32973.1 hypothetical protein F530_01565 [Mycoplasmoides pneumoniae 54089]ALA33676.1 hypothetical protein F531_01565 [Mycoplasmoides pneumoniae 54524]ARQ36567.1 hypothetical protein BIX58_01570 [Mycoplasmoides pneumoniae]